MKLRTKFMMFTAAMALSTGMAMAAITGSDVVSTYQAQNYSYIQVKEGPTQIKVEAIKDGMQIEVIYDKATGDVVSTESGVASAEDAAKTGVSVKVVKADFGGKDGKHGKDDDQPGVDDGDHNGDVGDDDGDNGDDNGDDSGDDNNDSGDDNSNDDGDSSDHSGDSGDDNDGDGDGGSGGNGSSGSDDSGCAD